MISFFVFLSISFCIIGIITLVLHSLNKIIVWTCFNILYSKYNDNNGLFYDENTMLVYYQKTANIRKYFYQNQSVIIIFSFIVLYPISKYSNQIYELVIILLILLSYDYFFRKFALDWVRKTNYQTKYNYTEIYWESSNLEEFLIPFIQIFLIPISIISFVHFDITYYTFNKPIPYSSF